MKTPDFEWDDHKSIENALKHGVSFYEAQRAFADPKRLIAEDMNHSATEKRYYCFGATENGILTVRFTYRKKTVRIFGAGFWRKGKKIYEKKNSVHR